MALCCLDLIASPTLPAALTLTTPSLSLYLNPIQMAPSLYLPSFSTQLGSLLTILVPLCFLPELEEALEPDRTGCQFGLRESWLCDLQPTTEPVCNYVST